MKKIFFAISAVILLSNHTLAQSSVGLNLTEISPWSSQAIYVDVMKNSSRWMIQHTDFSDWDVTDIGGIPVNLSQTAEGYPTEIPFTVGGEQLQAHCFTSSAQPAPWYYPSGDYTLIFEGTGEIVIDWDIDGGWGTYTTPDVPHTVTVSSPTALGIHLTITQSSATDPIRNIRLIMPGFESTYETEPFHPTFLSLINSFPVLRFMKPTSVEEDLVINWNDRTMLGDRTYAYSDYPDTIHEGMPYESVIQLANLSQKDPWVCIPFLANDDYIMNMAQLFRDNLDPDLTLYLEYGNETWNADYPLALNYMESQGLSLGLDTDPMAAGLEYHTLRSMEAFQIFQSEFGTESDRIFEVLATQGWDVRGQIIVNALGDPTINPSSIIPDALSIAPYIGGEVINNVVNAGLQCTLTVDDMLDSLEQKLTIWMDDMVPPFRDWADSLGIQLVAYEGGQYLSPLLGAPTDPCIGNLVIGANQDSRMTDIYCDYYDYWFNSLDGDLFMTFTFIEAYSDFGAFGLLESTWQDTSTSPKWQAHNQCVFASLEDAAAHSFFTLLYPNPMDDYAVLSIENSHAGNLRLIITDAIGNIVRDEVVNSSGLIEIHRAGMTSGVYFINLEDGTGTIESAKLIIN